MLMSGIFGENLFDDWMGFPMRELANVDRRLYGKNASHIMKTDVKETAEGFELDIDLPGYKKENVNAELKDGYLTVSAETNTDNEEKDADGRYIRRERYRGSCKRSFCVRGSCLPIMTSRRINSSFPCSQAMCLPPTPTLLPWSVILALSRKSR